MDIGIRYSKDDRYFYLTANSKWYNVSEDVEEIYRAYSDKAQQLTNLSFAEVMMAGHLGGAITNGEAAIAPDNGYPTGLAHTLRNMIFGMLTTDKRWDILKNKELPLPILDYGGGVGILSCFLSTKFEDQVYHYDQPGLQTEFSSSLLKQYGVKPWNGESVGTVLLYNVLEHIKEAKDLVTSLEKVSNKLYATLDYRSGDATDVLSENDGKELVRQLYKKGQLLPCDGSSVLEESEAYTFLWGY